MWPGVCHQNLSHPFPRCSTITILPIHSSSQTSHSRSRWGSACSTCFGPIHLMTLSHLSCKYICGHGSMCDAQRRRQRQRRRNIVGSAKRLQPSWPWDSSVLLSSRRGAMRFRPFRHVTALYYIYLRSGQIFAQSKCSG